MVITSSTRNRVDGNTSRGFESHLLRHIDPHFLMTESADFFRFATEIVPTLQRAVAPVLNVDIRLLVQLADGGRRHLAAPQSLGNILHAPDGYACQVHLNEGFFHAALPAAIPLNDGGFKGDPLELGYLERDIGPMSRFSTS